MLKSESIKELASALSKAQGEMDYAKKDSNNPFFKSKYADLAAVITAIKEPLSKNGLSYVQMVEHDTEPSTSAIVTTMLMHVSGEWLSGSMKITPVKNDPQGMGSAITYARRYALQAMVGLAADDDDGNAASGNNNQLPERKKPSPSMVIKEVELLSIDQVTELTDLLKEINANEKEFFSYINGVLGGLYYSISEIEKKHYETVKKILLKKKEKQNG
ncbi:MAG: ERF family protein [Candidatus Pacebacteria bacterium]|nr:ERF family protein [Candidatus Paceibacterota bacterium]